MNEDPSMDKKAYGVPPSSRGQDVNRPRDGSGGSQNVKNFSRPPRRRESPTHSNAPQPPQPKTRPEVPNNRPTPQKNKTTMDKRPRARLSDSLQSVGEELREQSPELGSIQKFGSKKQNLNHLLNFHFAPREISRSSLTVGSWRSYNSHPGGGWRSRSSGGTGATNLRPKFNKENFLQANCQFLVKSSGDYSAHKYNPDLLVNWDNIEQINIRVTGEFPRCPICLDNNTAAAKMVKCGHIFCWPCILHYLALSDKPQRKCPICYEPIYKHELKSVVAMVCDDVNVGEELEMQLMFRSKDSYNAMPLMCKGGASFDWESIFAKLLVVTPEEVKSLVLDREQRELNRRFLEDEHCPEICFVEQALRELDTRRSNVLTTKEVTKEEDQDQKLANVLAAIHPASDWLPSPDSDPLTDQLLQQNFDVNTIQEDSVVQKQRKDSGGNDSIGANVSDEDSTRIADKDGCYYFYQAIRGQNIFLHPLNMAMLSKSFGPEPTNWPQVVQFRILEKESISMVDDMRKRLKFLQHLPMTTNVQLVEVELKTPIVSQEILQEFSQQLEARKKRRLQRVRDERRREKALRDEEKKRQNQTQCPKFESTLDFPEYRYEDFENATALPALTPNEEQQFMCTTTDEESSHSGRSDHQLGAAASASTSPPSSSGMSFAQIVSQKNSSTSPFSTGLGGGAWGRNQQPRSEARDSCSGSELDPEEYTTVPQYRMSMSDAISRAIANISIVEESEQSNQNNNNGNGKKKGKKNKGKVLFNTGIGF